MAIGPCFTPAIEPCPTSTAKPRPTPTAKPCPTPATKPHSTPAVEPCSTPAVESRSTPAVEPCSTPAVEPCPALVVEPFPAPVAQPSPTAVVGPPPAPVDTETQDPDATGLDTGSVPTSPTTITTAAAALTEVSADRYPKFITTAILTHLSGDTNVEGWSDTVQMYLKFENASPSKSVSGPSVPSLFPLLITMQTTRLPQKQRPTEVDSWLKDSAGPHPVISDTATYAGTWTSWWIECQPPDHPTTSWPLPRKPLSPAQWGKLMKGGKYGMFLFLMSLSWWVKSSELVQADFIAAMEDFHWVLQQLTDALTTTTLPLLGAPEISRGKRKVVLTEKALAGGESVQKRFRR